MTASTASLAWQGSSGRPMNNHELAAALGATSLALGEALDAHRRKFGTLIPHAFMTDVLACVRARLLAAGNRAAAARHADVAAVLDALEHGMAAGDRETRNVIAISFVSLGEDQAFFDALLPLLGPRVRSQLRGK